MLYMMFSQILKSCPADHYLTRITKADKDFAKTLVLKIQIFQSKLETFTKSKKIILSTLAFLVMKIKKYPIYVSKQCCKEKHVDLLLIGEGEKKHILSKDFNSIMYDHSLHRGRKHFCCYCFHGFITEKNWKHHIKDCFLKLIVNKWLRCLKKVNMLNSKIFKEK